MPGLAILSDLLKNDFLDVITSIHIPYSLISFSRIETINITEFSGLIVFADSYPKIHPWILTHPKEMNSLISGFLDAKKPVFTEFCPFTQILTDKMLIPPHIRLIVRSNDSELQSGFNKFSLLEAHQITLLESVPKSSVHTSIQHLHSFGRVIGVRTARLGLPDDLFLGIAQYRSLIISSTKISNFSLMEFRPRQDWIQLIFNICKFLTRSWFDLDETALNTLIKNSEFANRLSQINNSTRDNIYHDVILTGVNWFENAGVFNDSLAQHGVYEGLESGFDSMGRKKLRNNDFEPQKLAQRGDCTMDTALTFFLARLLDQRNPLDRQQNDKYSAITNNILQDAFSYWQYLDQSICRGFFGWFNDYYNKYVFYSDDHGRCSFNLLLMAYITKNEEWISRAAAAVIASKQTHGKNGHRSSRIDLKNFWKHNGRKWFRNRKYLVMEYGGPHYDAWSFTSMLYGAWIFQDQDIIVSVEKGLVDYMKQFPKMRVEHSVNDDFSKLLVASVFLYNATHKPEHLAYVKQIIAFFANFQDQRTGAIPERDPYLTRHCKETKNNMYGKIEASVYNTNDDTISDQLYSSPFIGWGLYFAYQTGQCPEALPILMKLMDFLSSIQIRSPNAQLNGAWMRAFDYTLGEYFGSNGDAGWGAYSIETGWMVAPILSLFEMVQLKLNPFIPCTPNEREQFLRIYQKELKIQIDLEQNWKKFTPKAKSPPKK